MKNKGFQLVRWLLVNLKWERRRIVRVLRDEYPVEVMMAGQIPQTPFIKGA